MRVSITCYKDILCIETHPPFEKDDIFIPSGEGRIGCVLLNTKDNLGISNAALKLLRKIPKSRDAIGDVMWWPAADGKYAFGWLGGPHSLKDPETCEGDRSFAVRDGQFTAIPNQPPIDAKRAINAQLKELANKDKEE